MTQPRSPDIWSGSVNTTERPDAGLSSIASNRSEPLRDTSAGSPKEPVQEQLQNSEPSDGNRETPGVPPTGLPEPSTATIPLAPTILEGELETPPKERPFLLTYLGATALEEALKVSQFTVLDEVMGLVECFKTAPKESNRLLAYQLLRARIREAAELEGYIQTTTKHGVSTRTEDGQTLQLIQTEKIRRLADAASRGAQLALSEPLNEEHRDDCDDPDDDLPEADGPAEPVPTELTPQSRTLGDSSAERSGSDEGPAPQLSDVPTECPLPPNGVLEAGIQAGDVGSTQKTPNGA